MSHDPNGYIGVGEAAAMTGASSATIKRAARSGDLPHALKMPGASGAYLFDKADVAEWAARRAGVAA